MPEPRPASTASLSLPRWQRRAIYAAFGLIALSGIAWLAAHYLLAEAGEFGASEHPLAHWSLVAHGIGAYLLLWLVGSLWPLHMRLAWRLHRNRTTGLVMGALLSSLALTGLWLYYGSIDAREGVSLAHWLLGLGLVPLLVLHIVIGRSRPAPPQR